MSEHDEQFWSMVDPSRLPVEQETTIAQEIALPLHEEYTLLHKVFYERASYMRPDDTPGEAVHKQLEDSMKPEFDLFAEAIPQRVRLTVPEDAEPVGCIAVDADGQIIEEGVLTSGDSVSGELAGYAVAPVYNEDGFVTGYDFFLSIYPAGTKNNERLLVEASPYIIAHAVFTEREFKAYTSLQDDTPEDDIVGIEILNDLITLKDVTQMFNHEDLVARMTRYENQLNYQEDGAESRNELIQRLATYLNIDEEVVYTVSASIAYTIQGEPTTVMGEQLEYIGCTIAQVDRSYASWRVLYDFKALDRPVGQQYIRVVPSSVSVAFA